MNFLLKYFLKFFIEKPIYVTVLMASPGQSYVTPKWLVLVFKKSWVLFLAEESASLSFLRVFFPSPYNKC